MYPYGPYPYGPPPHTPVQFVPVPQGMDAEKILKLVDRMAMRAELKKKKEEEEKKKKPTPPPGSESITLGRILTIYAQLVAFGLPLGLITLLGMNQLLNMVVLAIKASVN